MGSGNDLGKPGWRKRWWEEPDKGTEPADA